MEDVGALHRSAILELHFDYGLEVSRQGARGLSQTIHEFFCPPRLCDPLGGSQRVGRCVSAQKQQFPLAGSPGVKPIRAWVTPSN